MGLAAKLVGCVIAGSAAFFALFGFVNLRMARVYSQSLVEQAADRITDTILRSARYEMLHNDRETLYQVIQQLGNGQGIRRIRIFNKEGRITLSTQAGEAGKVVNKDAEGCILCHSGAIPLQTGNGARPFTENGERLLGVMKPIYNSPDCANAACHAHPPSQTLLGVIDAHLALTQVDAQIQQQQHALTWFLVGAILFGCAAAAVFMWMAVGRPVKNLMDGLHRFAEGDLEYRLPVDSSDELGKLAGWFNLMAEKVGGVQTEIEEQVRRKTRELETAHRRLLNSEKMASIGKLAATAAHQINSPLFGILTYARLVLRALQKREFDGRDGLVEQLQTIERESKRCGDLVKNLLIFSREAPSNRGPCDLNTVAQRAILLVKHKLEMQSIELRENFAKELPSAHCDANQIQQVMLVLMVNASEAMPKGGWLEVSTAYDGSAEQCLLTAKDSGGGIPEDVLPRIFDPFFTTKEDQNRTGLGLAVAHSIVEQHGGEIVVHSKPGEGAEFIVKLPVSAPARVPAGVKS